MSNALLAMVKLQAHAVATIGNIAVTLLLLIGLVENMGFAAVGIALVGGQATAYLIRLAYLKAGGGSNLSRRMLVLHVVGGTAFGLATVAQDADPVIKFALLAATALVLHASLTQEERRQVLKVGASAWSRFPGIRRG